MIESVTSKAVVTSDRTIAAVARVPSPAAVETASRASVRATTVARDMAASAPVDSERVRLIKASIEAGTFPLSPATIADRLIAARYEWMNDDAS